jgi:hypothetical protein
MPKRIKKQLVTPAMRRDWLKRFEEDGQSMVEIKEIDHYDIRTIRKQIEEARQERESREARSYVVRQALEKHYADLLALAEKLDSEIIHSALPMGIKDDRLWTALHEHLPRSPLWKLIDKMDRLNDEIRDIEKRSEQRLWEEVRKENDFNLVSLSGVAEIGLRKEGLLGAMSYQLHSNIPGTLLDVTTSAKSETVTTIYFAGVACADVHTSQVDKAKEFITGLMAQVCQWPEYEELRKTLVLRAKVTGEIREELAMIILKRIVPGHCKYCPV